jgi:hypothetical protein
VLNELCHADLAMPAAALCSVTGSTVDGLLMMP